MRHKKAFFSVFEISFVLLILFSLASLPPLLSWGEYDYKESLDSYLVSLQINETFRQTIINENLSEESLTQNWSTIEVELENSFHDYELRIKSYDQNQSKLIFQCQTKTNKEFSSIYVVVDGNNYDFREVILGVCY